MIEPTDEMIYAFAGEPEITATDAHAITAGLAAVLAIVERDYRVAPRRKPSWRDVPGCMCAPTGRPYRLCPVHGKDAPPGGTP